MRSVGRHCEWSAPPAPSSLVPHSARLGYARLLSAASFGRCRRFQVPPASTSLRVAACSFRRCAATLHFVAALRLPVRCSGPLRAVLRHPGFAVPIGIHASVRRRVAALARYGRRSVASFTKSPRIALGPRTDPTGSTASRIHRLPTTTLTDDSLRSVAALTASCLRLRLASVPSSGVRRRHPCRRAHAQAVVTFGSPPLPIRWGESVSWAWCDRFCRNLDSPTTMATGHLGSVLDPFTSSTAIHVQH